MYALVDIGNIGEREMVELLDEENNSEQDWRIV